MASSTVIGREAELEAIGAFLVAAGDGPAALLLSGEPGIGKTILWEAGIEHAAGRGRRVLAHRSVETEVGFAFAGVSDLVETVLHEFEDDLVPPRRRALEVALLLAEPSDEAPDLRAVGLAVLDGLRVLAERSPVVLALDDLQWLDASSAMVLMIALRRLGGERIGILAAVRGGHAARAPFELPDVLGQGRSQELVLEPFTLGDVHRLLKRRLGVEIRRPDLTRICEASGGNPLYALELGRALAEASGPHAAPRPLRVPASLRELLAGRLGRLPTASRGVLLTISALARPTVDLVVAASDDRDRALDSLAIAAREGVVVLDESAVRFAHPLLGSVCYEQAPPWELRALHRRLSTIVSDVEEAARHMALGAVGADATVAARLDAATAHAAARGATVAAAELAELAASRTPPGSAAAHRRRRFAAAGLLGLAGDFDRARAIYDELLAELPGGVERADVLRAAALTAGEDLATRIRLCEEALRHAAGDDVRSAQILGHIGITRWLSGDVRAALRDARSGLASAERVSEDGLLAVALGRVGMIETWALDVTPGLLERAVAIEETLEHGLAFHESPTYMLAVHLVDFDGVHRAREMLQRFEATAGERGDEHTRLFALVPLAAAEWYAGHWQRSLAHATTACELAEQINDPQGRGMAGSVGALIHADLGRIEQARASATDGLQCATAMSDEIFSVANIAALGHLELALGDPHAAAGHLRDLPARLLQAGHRHGIGAPPVWPDAIEALLAVGELDLARSYLGQYEELAARASRWSRIVAARCRGLLAAAEGDAPGAVEAFASAFAEDEPRTYPFERARTLLALGATRRHEGQRRAAREALGQALAIFDGLGARPWADKTHAEAMRISGRRPPTDELTEAEQRVASLAAVGRHNSEIAAELFIGVGTVEAHLSRVYRKLGLRSRTELAHRLAKPGNDPAKV
jgi:DNA-binding CsgD family transcriptional regulator